MLRLATLLAVLALSLAACMPRGPVVDLGSKPPVVGGTISGVVRASASSAPLSGRKVTALELATGERYEASTAVNGGYTMKVPRGKYRLDVEVRASEMLVERPADVQIDTSDVDASRNFVIGPARSR